MAETFYPAQTDYIDRLNELVSGGISGLGAVDNAVVRTDGTGGSSVQNSPVIIEDLGEISQYREKQITVSGTTYTIDSSTPSGCVIRFTSATSVTVTLANSIPVGWNCMWRQMGAGQITFTAGSGATRVNRSSHTKSAGQYGAGTLNCDSNAGAAAVIVLTGDTAA